jgi:hypothetical protein
MLIICIVIIANNGIAIQPVDESIAIMHWRSFFYAIQSNFLNKYNNYRLNMDLLFSVKGPTHYYYDLHLMSSLGLAMNDTLDYKQSLGRSENDTFPVPL